MLRILTTLAAAMLLMAVAAQHTAIATESVDTAPPAILALHSAAPGARFLASLGLEVRPETSRACCKICTVGKACGDTCIAREKICHQPPGCACDG
jgi:hypothetical protein